MKPKTIGVLGGAGPLAGAFLVERILRLAQTFYGCVRDEEFPKVILISFPFSDMLSFSQDGEKVQGELERALTELKKCGAEILAIACNTLHAFLSHQRKGEVVHLPNSVQDTSALALGSSTSATYRLFPCIYPSAEVQSELDAIIFQTLKGDEERAAARLSKIILQAKETTIVLGCTEFSCIREWLRVPGKIIIDPLEIAAEQIIKRSFQC